MANLSYSRGIETDQDRLEVESYLGKKWGVPMSYGFAKRTDWVYQDTKFEQAINFAGAAVNERSLSTGPNKTTTGVGTGTDNIGGLWMGKLRVGNQGYIRTGKVTFGTRSDDGSVFWIDLDEDGDFSRSGAYGDEMVVDNKGGHGQINRTGTRFLGRQSPLFMQAGVIAHKGFAFGADGYQLSKHPTFQEEKSTLSSTAMVQGQWHHIVMVVDRDAGRLKQYLNGNLVAEDSFSAGTEGEYSLGDWFIGGMPASNDRFTGLIDDARIYSIALSDRDISKIYNNHGGDMGIVADFVAPTITDDSNISVQLNFLKFDETIAVNGFDQSDILISGGSVSDYLNSDGNISFNIIPDASATEVEISLAEGAGNLSGDNTLPADIQILLVPPVPGKSDLLSWWWFDEGTGTKVTDSIGGGLGDILGGAAWSVKSSYGNSLSFQNTGDYANLGLPVAGWDSNAYSLGFWFLREGESFSWSNEQISNVMFSMGNDENSSMQIGTNGSGIEVFLNTTGKRTRTSVSAGVQDNVWHYFSLAYDSSAGDELNLYLDGALIGSTSVFGGTLDAGVTESWLLGLAQLSSPSSGRFIGNIDDIRLFNGAISLADHQRIYNRGMGDLGLVVEATYPTATDRNPIVIDLNFSRYGMPSVVDFNSSLFVSGLTNAVIHRDVNATTGANFQIEVNASNLGVALDPITSPGIVEFDLLEGVGIDSSGKKSSPISFKIGFGRPVVGLENLVAWWDFDENNGTTVTDYMNGFVGNFVNNVDGNVTFDQADKKFGTSSLRFPKTAWVSTNAFASELGIGGNSPRTISFWMKALDHGGNNNNDTQAGVYGIGQRSNNRMWAIRGIFNGSTYRRFYSQHWGWDQQVFVSEGIKNKWMHIAHVYSGTNVIVYVNGTQRANWVKNDIDTSDSFALQFGRWTDETRTDRTFLGLLDDFRVYNADLNFNDIGNLYGDGNGDFKVMPSFELDPVVETNPASGKVTFYRNGKPVEVNGFTQNDLSITNGAITDLNASGATGVYTFTFTLDGENLPASIALTSNIAEDSYNQGNDPASITTRRMYRAVTRGQDLVAWWPFDDDGLSDNFALSKTGDAQIASLYNVKISHSGRFGKGAHFLKNKSDARIRIDNNGINLGNAWTLSAWAKNLFPPNSTGRSTLYRGQDKQSNRDWDRYLTIRGNDRVLSFFDGDDGNANNRYRTTSYQLDPLTLNQWHHFAVVGKGSQTSFYIDGGYVGFADRREQSDVYYIGNSSDNEAFAEFIDDVRIYGVSLEEVEISQIYGGGFGDMYTSVKVEQNSSVDASPQVLKLLFGKDGQTVSVPNSDISKDDFELKFGEIGDLNSSVSDSAFLVSVIADANITKNEILIPAISCKV